MPVEATNAELLAVARELARLGGDTARRLLGKVSVSRKSDDTPVTDADHQVQQTLLNIIAARFPSHAVIVEEVVPHPERHADVASADICWVIDPIDGTRNFARGLGVYSTSIGVMRAGRPVAGAIYDVSSGRLYSAVQGGGTYIDDERVALDDGLRAAESVIMISSFRRTAMPPAVGEWMKRYFFRNLGSLCIHLAWLAAGYADAVYSAECKLWDLAAGGLLIEEAGGIITRDDGRPIWPIDLAAYSQTDIPILAATPPLHGELLKTLIHS